MGREEAIEGVRATALALMTERGYDAVTVEQVAGAAGCSPSSVYRYVGTKDALVLRPDRAERLVERVAGDDPARTPLTAFRRALVAEWGDDESAAAELALVVTEPSLLEAFERQLTDQRAALAGAFATRRGDTGAKVRDLALAGAALGLAAAILPEWQRRGGGRKALRQRVDRALEHLAASF